MLNVGGTTGEFVNQISRPWRMSGVGDFFVIEIKGG